MSDGVLSLTKHYVFHRLVDEVARVRPGMTPDEVRDRLETPHTELFDDLFAYSDFGVLDSVLMEASRSGSPGVMRLIWVALLAADHRLQRIVGELLAGASGRLNPEAFSTDDLEQPLSEIIDSRGRKAASNLLNYFEQARIVVPKKYGSKIVGIGTELDTRSAVPLSVTYLAERFGWDEPLDSALALGVNTWLNLTAAEFEAAFLEPTNAETIALPVTDALEDVPPVPISSDEVDETAAFDLDHPYRVEDESAGITWSGIREFDPDVMERASRLHRVLQNSIARWLLEHDLVPVSPKGPPRFDVGWRNGGAFWVAEVKSLNPQNEAHQIRLGLGQVLDYLHQLAEHGVEARAVLVVEGEPVGDHWAELCEEHGVLLTWPPFANLA